MAVVLHLTSILLSCWLSDIKFAEAYPTAYDKTPSEAWPSLRSWSSSRKTESQNVPSQKLSPLLPRSQKPGKSAAGGKVPAENSKMRNQMASPRGFQISIDAAPNTGHGDKYDGHDYSHPHGPSRYHHQNQLESQSRYSSQTGLFKNPGKDSPKHGFHLSISLPQTTAAPKPQGVVHVNAGFSGTSVHNSHNDPAPEAQKPASKIVNFFSTLFNQKGQSNTPTRHNHVYVQPAAQHQHSGPSSTHYQNPTNHWGGHVQVAGSTNAGSGVRNPVHHTVSNSAHPSSQWYPISSLPPDRDEVMNGVLQYARNINGQLMIPLDKCPGFERILEYVHHHQHHHHKKHHHPGHRHHHGHPYPPHQGPVQQQSGHWHHPSHHERHYPVQGHHHRHHHHGPKPDHTQFSLNVQGSGANRHEPAQGPVHQPGVYPHPYKLWQHAETGQTGGQYGRRDYDVGFGANVDVRKPHTPNRGNVNYVRTGRLSR